eukprot:3938870-Rhodomonas_salina.1
MQSQIGTPYDYADALSCPVTPLYLPHAKHDGAPTLFCSQAVLYMLQQASVLSGKAAAISPCRCSPAALYKVLSRASEAVPVLNTI